MMAVVVAVRGTPLSSGQGPVGSCKSEEIKIKLNSITHGFCSNKTKYYTPHKLGESECPETNRRKGQSEDPGAK